MPAPKGNKFWEVRSSHGRKPIFQKPEDLFDACSQYFEWVEENPLHESKAFAYEGKVVVKALPKMRAMTMQGLCRYIGIGTRTWADYRDREDFSQVIKEVEEILYDQKFSGAAAGLLNSNIIARDLGLKEKTASEHSGPDGGPIEAEVSINFLPVSN